MTVETATAIVPHIPPTPMRLIELAVEKGADADQLAKLMELQLKWQANEARLAYLAAMGRFKEKLPQVFKTKRVSFPNTAGTKTEYSHAELDKITEIIGEGLREVGITHAWRPSEGANGRIVMTCVLTHNASGHAEDVATLGGPPDTSGGKNNVQAIGSTTFYLQRYTLLAGTGIVPKGLDNDGATPTEGLPEETIAEYCTAMQDCSEMDSLQKMFKEAWQKAKTCADREAQSRFQKVYEVRKRELRK